MEKAASAGLEEAQAILKPLSSYLEELNLKHQQLLVDIINERAATRLAQSDVDDRTIQILKKLPLYTERAKALSRKSNLISLL